ESDRWLCDPPRATQHNTLMRRDRHHAQPLAQRERRNIFFLRLERGQFGNNALPNLSFNSAADVNRIESIPRRLWFNEFAVELSGKLPHKLIKLFRATLGNVER